VLPASARTGRSADRVLDGGAGCRTPVPGPLCGIALPGRCCARSPQGTLQAAVLFIARRQETQAGGADLGQLRQHLGLQPGVPEGAVRQAQRIILRTVRRG
jgi:hypothetical protein